MRWFRIVCLSPFLVFPAYQIASPGGLLPPSDLEFQELSLRLSEPSDYFDTDNLISNEVTFQHVVPILKQAPEGLAYIGVGPDQNFTYIVHLKPAISFVLDIRRDNLLELLFFRALFERSSDRWEFLSCLLCTPVPAGRPGDPADIAALVEFFDAAPADFESFEARFLSVWQHMRGRFPRLVRAEDEATVRRMAQEFCRFRLDLRFSSHGSGPRWYYPTFRDLMLTADREGRRYHYLDSEAGFQLLKQLQHENRIVPVVGNFGGSKALKGIAEYLKDRGLTVSAFYLSNVEFYLFHDRLFDQFATNISALPSREGLLIRSYFSHWRPHPASDPGSPVTMLAQPIRSFVEQMKARPYSSYQDLIFRDSLLQH